MGTLAILDDRATDRDPAPTARRYTDADREAAFHLWYFTVERSDRQTSAIGGYALSTVQQWRKSGDWDGRARALDDGAARSVHGVARAMVAPLFVKAVSAVSRILDDPDANANAKVKAAELAAGWNGLVVPKHSVSLTASATVSAPSAPLAELLRSAASDPALAPYLDPPSPPPPPLPPQGFTSEQACEGVGVPDPPSRQSRVSESEPGIGDILDAVYEERET